MIFAPKTEWQNWWILAITRRSFSEVKTIVEETDYALVNLEAPIVKGTGTPIKKSGPNLKCSPNVVDALAAAMKRMLAVREFAERCGKEAHKICERLSPDKVYGQWEEFITKIANTNKQ